MKNQKTNINETSNSQKELVVPEGKKTVSSIPKANLIKMPIFYWTEKV